MITYIRKIPGYHVFDGIWGDRGDRRQERMKAKVFRCNRFPRNQSLSENERIGCFESIFWKLVGICSFLMTTFHGLVQRKAGPRPWRSYDRLFVCSHFTYSPIMKFYYSQLTLNPNPILLYQHTFKSRESSACKSLLTNKTKIPRESLSTHKP